MAHPVVGASPTDHPISIQRKEKTMHKIFFWGTLTTMANGGGRDYLKPEERTPLNKMVYCGVEGELYEISDETLQTLHAFEERFGYIPVTILGDITMYVVSPVSSPHYWKRYVKVENGGYLK